MDSDQVLHEPGCAATEDGYRGLKFVMYEVVVLYYPSRENKGTDQLHGKECEADLCLCFPICKTLNFS